MDESVYLPEYLFHVTRPANADSIRKHGLKSGMFGDLYLSGSLQHALRFMESRIRVAYTGRIIENELAPEQAAAIRKQIEEGTIVTGIRVDGDKVIGMLPELEHNDQVCVVKVAVEDLDLEALEVSTDHNPAFFGEDTTSWVYWNKTIPPEVLEVTVIDFPTPEV